MKHPTPKVPHTGSDPSFAVAFGGGGARGLSHIHVIEALDELGIRPTANVDRPMMNMVIRKVYLRPTRSPMRPNTMAPKGRTRKPAA